MQLCDDTTPFVKKIAQSVKKCDKNIDFSLFYFLSLDKQNNLLILSLIFNVFVSILYGNSYKLLLFVPCYLIITYSKYACYYLNPLNVILKYYPQAKRSL